MAYYDDELDEEGQEQGSSEAVGPKAIGPESASLGAQGMSMGGAPTPSGAAPSAKPSSFTGISDYLNANKSQSQKLAGQVAQNVDQKAKMAEDSFAGAQNSFNQAVDSQQIAADEDLLGAVKSNAEQIAADEAKVGSFAKMRDASYSGPEKLEDLEQGQTWAGLQSALQKARSAKEATQSEEGRMGLIKEVSNNPRQSQGALTFDNLLLQSSPEAKKTIQGAGSNLNDIDERLGMAQQSAAQKAAQVKQANLATSQSAKNALNEGWSNFTGGLEARVSEADQRQMNAYNSFLNAVQSKPSNLLMPTFLDALGIGADTPTAGVDLSRFIDYADTADLKTVAGQEDYARQNALLKLMGENPEVAPFINEALDSQYSGTAGPGYSVRQGELKAALDARIGDFNRKLSQITETGTSDDPTDQWKQAALKHAAGLGPKPSNQSPGDGSFFTLDDYIKRNAKKVDQIKKLSKEYGMTPKGNDSGLVFMR